MGNHWRCLQGQAGKKLVTLTANTQNIRYVNTHTLESTFILAHNLQLNMICSVCKRT